MRNVAILFISALFLINCSENDTINVDNLGVLIFKSGYEGSSSIISSSNPQYADIKGEGKNGVFKFYVTEDAITHKIIDVENEYMHHPNTPLNELDGIQNFNPIKLYIPEPIINAVNQYNNNSGVTLY